MLWVVNPLNLVLLGKCEQVLLLALGGKQLSYISLGKGEEGLMLAPGCRPADVLNAFFFSASVRRECSLLLVMNQLWQFLLASLASLV